MGNEWIVSLLVVFEQRGSDDWHYRMQVDSDLVEGTFGLKVYLD